MSKYQKRSPSSANKDRNRNDKGLLDGKRGAGQSSDGELYLTVSAARGDDELDAIVMEDEFDDLLNSEPDAHGFSELDADPDLDLDDDLEH